MVDKNIQPPVAGAARIAGKVLALVSKLPAEQRPAMTARIQRSLLVRRVELEARGRGASPTFAELRRESARLMEERRRPIGLRARYPKAGVWRQAEIELQLELAVQGLEDRIALLPTLDDVRHCYVDGLDPAAAGAPDYVDASMPPAEQLVLTQRRLLAALPPVRQESLLGRLACAYLKRHAEFH